MHKNPQINFRVEQQYLDILNAFGRMKGTKKQTQAFREAMKDLKSRYPEEIQHYIDLIQQERKDFVFPHKPGEQPK